MVEKNKTQFAEFTENTTIHGVKYLGAEQRPITEKLFWIIVFAISFIILGFFVDDVLKKFNQKSVILVEDEQPTPIYSIPFPAVTICPTVKIKTDFFSDQQASEWWDNTPHGSMILDLANVVCNQQFLSLLNILDQGNSQHLNRSHIELLHKISPKLKEALQTVQFASKRNPINEHVEVDTPLYYILTNEGVCFTFNMPSEIIADDPSLQTEYKYHDIPNKTKSWDYDFGYYDYPRFPQVAYGSGPGSGLFIVSRASIEDVNTICQPTDIGFKILLHSPGEYPTTIEKFISIPYHTMAHIIVTPKITKTSDDLKSLDPKVRHCFFNHERKLKYFTYYNRANCKLECLANYSQQVYGCVHFSLPRTNDQPICGKSAGMSQIYDMKEVIDSYFQFKAMVLELYKAELTDDDRHDNLSAFSDLNCNCFPACNSIEYEYSIEAETMQLDEMHKKYFSEEEEMDVVEVVVDIFFGATKVTGMTRKKFYTFSDLISSIGGLVGLFMGASILSVFELIYFAIVR